MPLGTALIIIIIIMIKIIKVTIMIMIIIIIIINNNELYLCPYWSFYNRQATHKRQTVPNIFLR